MNTPLDELLALRKVLNEALSDAKDNAVTDGALGLRRAFEKAREIQRVPELEAASAHWEQLEKQREGQ